MQRSRALARLHAAGLFLAWFLVCCHPAHATNYTTFHFDNARDGWNNKETRLNHATVTHISKYGDYALDGEVDAQPLYARGVVYVATENDSIYAVRPFRGVIWSRNFGVPVNASVNGNCAATAPTIGIQSTPVIDERTGSMYFVSYTMGSRKPVFTLHAISSATGADERSVDISSMAGDTAAQHQRAGLLLWNGTVYIAFSGVCDHHVDTSYGRILAYAATNLAFRGSFVTTQSPACGNFHLGTIWAMGFAPAADARGNIYVAIGNGCIDYSRTRNGGYGDTVLRLTPQLQLRSTSSALFAPCTAIDDNRHDQEMGAGGVVLEPETRFAVAGGKNGKTYVLRRDNLGGFRTPCPDNVAFEAETNWGIWGGPTAWKSGKRDYVAIPGTGPAGIRVYALNASTGALTLSSQTGEFLHNGGESAIVTSDRSGTPSTLILWTLTRPTTGTIYLQAYDALNVRKRLASVAAGSWANSGGYAAVSPTVVSGYVFVATNKELTIWGCCAQPATNTSSRRIWIALLLAALIVSPLFALLRRRVRPQ